jgi:hypothetical protein
MTELRFELNPDGRRFLMVRQGAGDKSGHRAMVRNCFSELPAGTAAGRQLP